MPSWYYVVGEQAAGPVEDDELRRLALDGCVRPGSLVTPVGATRWYTLSEFEGRLALHRNAIGEYGTVPGEAILKGLRPHAVPRAGGAGHADVADVPAPAGHGHPTTPGPPPGRFRRLLGTLIDVALFAAAAVAVGWLIGGVSVVHHDQRDTLRLEGRGIVLAGTLALAYFGVLAGATGWTVGKLVVGVRVVDGEDGLPIGPVRGVLRCCAAIAMLAAFVLPAVVDALWPLGDRQRRTLHDIMLGTVPVRHRRATADGDMVSQPAVDS